MTDPSTVIGSQDVHVYDDEHLDPFGGDSKTFDVTSAVDVARLQDEISKRCGVEVQIALSFDNDEQEVSSVHPAVLFVSPGSVDGRTVQGVLSTHSGGPAPAPAPEPVAPQDPQVAAAADKLAQGKTLTTAEISLVLKSLLGVSGGE